MGVAQRYHVVDVQFAGVGYNSVGVRCKPLSSGDAATVIGAESYGGEAFFDQHLVTCVLAVAVGVCPMLPVSAAVFRQCGCDGCDVDE